MTTIALISCSVGRTLRFLSTKNSNYPIFLIHSAWSYFLRGGRKKIGCVYIVVACFFFSRLNMIQISKPTSNYSHSKFIVINIKSILKKKYAKIVQFKSRHHQWTQANPPIVFSRPTKSTKTLITQKPRT